jgi:hypothetical protein
MGRRDTTWNDKEMTMLPDLNWFPASKRDPRVVDLYSRHYSSVKNGANRKDWLAFGISAPGETITLLTADCLALFVWTKQQFRQDGETGINCSVFRNEAPEIYLSSDLILEAEEIAWSTWSGERLFTHVDGQKVHGDGFCFKKAGWTKLNRRTKGGLIILEKMPC